MRDTEAYLANIKARTEERQKKISSKREREGLPPKYDEYSKKAKTSKNKQAVQLMNIFAYRYRLANLFTGIHAPGIGKSLDGYNAIESVFMASAAFEVGLGCWKVLKSNRYAKASGYRISDMRLADRLRRNEALKDLLKVENYFDGGSHESKQKSEIQKQYVLKFFETSVAGRSDNVNTIARLVRNYYVHGALSQNTIGMHKKQYRDDMWDLSDRILDECDVVWDQALWLLK